MSEGTRLPQGEASGPAERPRHFVAAVIHNEDEYRRAIDELTEAGIPRDSLGKLYGETGVAAIAGRQRRWLEALLSDEASYVERYEQEIRAGGYVIGVPLADGSDTSRDRVRGILKAHGARLIVTSGRWAHAVEE